jgi:transcriptional regulator with XRE-family HTH domain
VATAAALLREARRRAGLSQTELAVRAGVAQSVISAYETGRREPALSLADLPPGVSLFGLGRLQAALEAIVGTRVDVVPAQDLKPEMRARVEGELVPL